jgi:hypothetical protein
MDAKCYIYKLSIQLRVTLIPSSRSPIHTLNCTWRIRDRLYSPRSSSNPITPIISITRVVKIYTSSSYPPPLFYIRDWLKATRRLEIRIVQLQRKGWSAAFGSLPNPRPWYPNVTFCITAGLWQLPPTISAPRKSSA